MKSYFRPLTGLRAVAAFMVYFHHFNIFNELKGMSVIARMVDEFNIGVTIFFVLSGFLIYYRYSETAGMTKAFWWKYAKNRVARIYPMYFILTTIAFLFLVFLKLNDFSSKENFILYILNITFLRGFFDALKYSGIIQGWSLTVEECFYFFAPLVFIFFRPYRGWVVCIACLIGTGVLLTETIGRFDLYGLFRNYTFLFGFTFFGRVFEFFAGMYLARIYKQKNWEVKKGSINTLIGGILILACSFLLSLVTQHYHVQQGIFHPWGRVVNNLIMPVSIVILLKGLLVERNWFTRMLSSSLFDLLGKSSYVFYLIHMGLLYNLIVFLFPHHHYLLPFVILNIAAVLLYRYVERPLHNYISKPERQLSVQTVAR
jgi:peptidoglycan/LPS O-acetylase OafA/YrhL